MSAPAVPADPPRLRPLALGEILDVSLRLFRAHAPALCAIVLVLSVPVVVLSTLVTAGTTTRYDVVDGATYDDETAFAAGQLGIVLLQFVLFTLSTVACFRAIVDAYVGRPASWRSSVGFAARRAPAALWLSILVLAGVAAGFLAFVIPGIWLSVAWSVAVPVLLVERLRGPRALSRSFDLVRGRWWTAFTVLLVAVLLSLAVSVAVGLGGAALIDAVVAGDGTAALVLEGVVGLIAQTLTAPFFAAVTVVLYVDLRLRKEGFDLAALAASTGDTPSPEGSASPSQALGGPQPDGFGGLPGGWAPPVAPGGEHRTEDPRADAPADLGGWEPPVPPR